MKFNLNNSRITLIVGVIFFFIFAYTFYRISYVSISSSNHPKDTIIKNQQGYGHNQTLAFALGASGSYNYLEAFKCKSAVESLAKVAGFKGPIYLLTDDTTCYDEKEIRKNAQSNDFHILNIKKVFKKVLDHDLRSTLHQHENKTELKKQQEIRDTVPSAQGGSSDFQIAMALKTFIIDEIIKHNSKIETIVWYDCDVIAIRQGCAKEMMDYKFQFNENKPFYLSQYGHVGSFAVSTQDFSKQALIKWREKIIHYNSGAKKGVPDFLAFNELFSSNFSLFPSVFKDHFINDTGIPGEDVCMTHLSNGRCLAHHLGPKGVNKILDKLSLKSAKNRNWCPGSIRRMKKYGQVIPLCDEYSYFL
eukprot:gene10759-14449_t